MAAQHDLRAVALSHGLVQITNLWYAERPGGIGACPSIGDVGDSLDCPPECQRPSRDKTRVRTGTQILAVD